MSSSDPSDHLSLMDLFRMEVEAHGSALTRGLLAVEQRGADPEIMEGLMRAAHSIKGAARIVGLDSAVRVAHGMEDILVAAQRAGAPVPEERIDVLLRGVDFLNRVSRCQDADLGDPEKTEASAADELIHEMTTGESRVVETAAPPAADAPESPSAAPEAAAEAAPEAAPPARRKRTGRRTTEIFFPPPGADAPQGVLRVDAKRMDRILGLAGLARVETGRVGFFSTALLRLRERHVQLAAALEEVREAVRTDGNADRARAHLDSAARNAEECRALLTKRLADVQDFERRTARLTRKLHDEAVATRMRPIGDGVAGLPRMVRDLARSLGKNVVLEVVGEATPVDRDVLERIEAPLTHLIRNGLDHGIELPPRREAAGKAKVGRIVLEAAHRRGLLHISISDDGAGVNMEELRRAVVGRGLEKADVAANLSDDELLQFLLLPEFTLKREVTELSGRGVGLDVVRSVVRSIGGTLRISSVEGVGTRFDLHLPLTLAVTRALAVTIAGEICAVSLSRITAVLSVAPGDVQRIEGRAFVLYGDRRIGLVEGGEVLELGEPRRKDGVLHVIVVGGAQRTYGLVVDRLLGEHDFVVQPLDPRLGKVADVAAAALMQNGTPVLLLDVDDVLRSIEVRLERGRLGPVQRLALPQSRPGKRVLVVDDSITVREVERKLLEAHGYVVKVSVDGVDGWNSLRKGRFDLVLTDVDMPRMDGIALLERIRADPETSRLPVVIVSYKDREEDRRRGLEAGADYYLTKGSFHDETLLRAVEDLIGKAHS